MRFDGITFLICTLATFRTAHLIAGEAGPRNVFGRLRARAGLVVAANGLRIATPGSLGELAGCPLCLSVWLAPLFLSLLHFRLSRPIVWALAISGGSVLTEHALEWLGREA